MKPHIKIEKIGDNYLLHIDGKLTPFGYSASTQITGIESEEMRDGIFSRHPEPVKFSLDGVTHTVNFRCAWNISDYKNPLDAILYRRKLVIDTFANAERLKQVWEDATDLPTPISRTPKILDWFFEGAEVLCHYEIGLSPSPSLFTLGKVTLYPWSATGLTADFKGHQLDAGWFKPIKPELETESRWCLWADLSQDEDPCFWGIAKNTPEDGYETKTEAEAQLKVRLQLKSGVLYKILKVGDSPYTKVRYFVHLYKEGGDWYDAASRGFLDRAEAVNSMSTYDGNNYWRVVEHESI